ncbi:MAG: protein kinase [Candidatus Hydrogenedentes bacterium]|nr:protein kinase [Candidatus Hydrogenedentota bacterium]
METLSKLWSTFWNSTLDVPLNAIRSIFNVEIAGGWAENTTKAILSLLIVFLVLEVISRYRSYRRRQRNKSLLSDAIQEDARALNPDSTFIDGLEGAKNLDATIGPLKKNREYAKMAQVYASVNRPKDAAKWYKKAGDLRQSAMELAKAGYTVNAAKMLDRLGEHVTAGRFYAEKEYHVRAAKAFEKGGLHAEAAKAYIAAKKPALSAQMYVDYFKAAPEPLERRAEAAQQCYAMLEDQKTAAKIGDDLRNELLSGVAGVFGEANRMDLAATIYRSIGALEKAGGIYLKAGKLELAAQCMKEAGNTKEAARIGGRYYETRQLWKEAGMAYEGAGEFRRAGDCFSKGMDPVRAAVNYQKAGEFFGAGFALIHAGKWESAIAMFQKVPETEANFGESRALLGRCFYELKAYDQCAATLENYLTGERVRTGNIEYFWMLALAYEQLGQLDKSKAVLLKIRSVDVAFRDVSRRLSNIETRLSMVADGTANRSGVGMPTTPAPLSGGESAAVMSMVENSLGSRYKLERELGRGGMGVVYKAIDTQLDRAVALKFLGTLVDGNEEFKQRFLREAKAAAQVNHPNILAIYDIGASEGKSYIAMEYIEGPNLHSYLRSKGVLSPREAVNITGQAFAALAAIHEAGIIHRDIKPDNILLAKGGLVKLMDFGLAKGHGKNLTGTNVIMGTPCYMAPEQTRGENVDARSDIYAMGLVLHELLTGKTYFMDGNVLQRQQDEMPVPPSAMADDIPPDLDAFVLKSVAKEPRLRFQSAREAMEALRNLGR